ncbi:MAG TPA: hypothetical protein VFN76_07735 [Candidatus Limnocylindria bacterium]|nr:hypothetical protein [Candidatus Limnocylindria bacterium]
MRTFVGELDRFTAVVVAIGSVVGLLWALILPVGIGLSGFVAAVGAMLLVIRRRWLEIGLLLLPIGLIPLVAYRWFGAPVVEALPGDRPSLELIAPGAAYLFFIVGLAVTMVAGWHDLRNAQRRERVEAAHAERRRRLDADAP